jgi:hypothetical protein
MVYLLSSSEDTAASRTLASRTPRMTMSIQEDEVEPRPTNKEVVSTMELCYVKYGKSGTPSIERKFLPVSIQPIAGAS